MCLILEVNNYNYVCKWIKYLCFNCVCGPLQYGKSFTTDTSQQSTWLKRVVIFLWFDNIFFNIQYRNGYTLAYCCYILCKAIGKVVLLL
jgi:hypothetical protein